jgi:glycosyltransferase involved in cell wall biosynthesis
VYGNRMAVLASLGHEIYSLAFHEDDVDVAHMAFCRYVVRYELFPRKRENQVRGRFSLIPEYIRKRHNRDLMHKLENLALSGDFDVLSVESMNMAHFLKAAIPVNMLKVLHIHNIDHILIWRSARLKGSLLERVHWRLEALKALVYERAVFRSGLADLYTFVSESEMAYAILSPIGVKELASTVCDEQETVPGRVVFVGNLSYFSNVESVNWFVQAVMPELARKSCDLHLMLVGKSPAEEIRALPSSHANISLIPNVADVRPYLDSAHLVIAPMVSGAGVKVKILEALAAGCPVVTTELGADGVHLTNGEHLLVTSNFDEVAFAAACEQVLRNPAEHMAMARRGQQHVLRCFGWRNVVSALAQEFEDRVTLKRE